MRKKIYAFDFDGTLTTRDTLIAFIRYAKGTGGFVLGFLRHAHLLALMKLRLYPDRSEYHLIAFGDSRGDKELLAFADEAHYKPFRR